MNNSTEEINCQGALDEAGTKWTAKKKRSELLGYSYNRIGLESRSEKVLSCSNILQFRHALNNDKWKIYKVFLCKDRLCPLCSWRRSLKAFHQLSSVMSAIQCRYKYQFCMITLTCKNVESERLNETIDNLYKAVVKLLRLKATKVFKGTYRVLEINHDSNKYITKKMYYRKQYYFDNKGLKVGDINPNFNFYHPHIHMIVALPSSYFHGRDYIKQEELTEMWRKCLDVDYKPIVNVEKVSANKNHKGETNVKSAVHEVAKYTTKDCDYIVEDCDITDEAVYTLCNALENRRLYTYTGCFKTLLNELVAEGDTVENGDLLHITGEEELSPEYVYCVMSWTGSLYNLVETGIIRNHNVKIEYEE